MQIKEEQVKDFLKNGGDLLKALREKTPEEGQKLTIAIYAEGVREGRRIGELARIEPKEAAG